jgi:hypothetical protein
MPNEYLVTLTVAPAIEESLVDWLLEFHGQVGFTSFSVHGHSSRPEGLTLAEQVSGRRKQTRFQIHLSSEQTPNFIENLRSDFGGVGLHYWVSPVLESGRI